MRPKKLEPRYAGVWLKEGSPLMVYSRRQAEGVQAALTLSLIHIFAVMRFEHFDVIARIQDARGHVQQLERGVDAHAHVGREYDGGFLDVYKRQV